MRNKAVIWDMDGVILDSAREHFLSWQEVFGKRGISFTEEQFRRNFGQRNDNIIRKVMGETISQAEIGSIAEEKEKGFRGRIGASIQPLPGVIALISALKEHGFKMALASSGPQENIRLLITTLGINSYFDVVVAGRDVAESKPSPQIFLLAAKKVEVEPAECIVIEDSIAGITAAKRAGMRCLAVTNTHPLSSLTEADLVVGTLAAVSVNDLKRLLASSSKEEGTNRQKQLVNKR